MMETIFAATIYRTPVEWGNEQYADKDTTERDIESLRATDADWNECSLADCAEFTLVRSNGNLAVYEREHVRHAEYVILSSDCSGYYEFIQQSSNLDDATEAIA